MSSQKKNLTQQLLTQFRYTSANSVMVGQVVAETVGLHPTDTECLDYLLLNGPATAGQLANLTGLTTGAITAMLDRLEKVGYVQREHDKKDRRRVIVVPNEAKIYAEIMPHIAPMGMALEAVCSDFSEAELEVVLKFITQANMAASQFIARARAGQ